MTNKEAIKNLKLYREVVGMPKEFEDALEMAIEALDDNDKLAKELQNCLEMYKKKKTEVKALKRKILPKQ